MNRSRYPLIQDEELVAYALLGNLDAFDELVRRFRHAVILVAEQALHSRPAAEDIAQETFLLAFKALPQLQTPAKFAGWLYAIARHRAQRMARKEGKQIACELSTLDRLLLRASQEMANGPAETFAALHERDCIAAEIAKLPFEYRIVLTLRCYEDWPLARIAEFLSLSLPTVKWRLHEGRERLRRQLLTHQEN